MSINSFDIKLLFLSFLDSYQYNYTFLSSSLSPEFKFLSAKAAFNITAEKLPEELKKDFYKGLK